MRIKTAYLVIILFLSAAFVVGCSDTQGGGQQNEAVDFSYLSFINGEYTYTVYDEYTAVGERNVGVRVVNKSTNKTFDIEGISEGAAGGLLFLTEKYPKLGRPIEGLDSIAGIWLSTDYDENHGTDVSILPTSGHEFNMEVHAFVLNAQGCPHIGDMYGKGKVNGNIIEFSLEGGDVKGEIRVADDRLLITYTGDTSKYAGLNVIFETEFKRSDKT